MLPLLVAARRCSCKRFLQKQEWRKATSACPKILLMLSRIVPQVGRDGNIIIAAAALRTQDYGFISVFLGVNLTLLDFSALQAGLVFSAIMAGSALSNMLASWKGDTIGRKRMFIAMSLLMVAGGMGFSISSDIVVLMLVGVFAGDDFRGRRPHGLHITGYCRAGRSYRAVAAHGGV